VSNYGLDTLMLGSGLVQGWLATLEYAKTGAPTLHLGLVLNSRGAQHNPPTNSNEVG